MDRTCPPQSNSHFSLFLHSDTLSFPNRILQNPFTLLADSFTLLADLSIILQNPNILLVNPFISFVDFVTQLQDYTARKSSFHIRDPGKPLFLYVLQHKSRKSRKKFGRSRAISDICPWTSEKKREKSEKISQVLNR